jgi:hypothetical protein
MYCCVVRAARMTSLRVSSLLTAVVLIATPAAAQLVTPRTVPVLQDEQFEIYPTSRPGLGGISIALDDTLADPFSNPAKATRLRGLMLTMAPYTHGITENRGGGQTLPIGFFASAGDWSGALLGAFQQLDRAGVAANGPTSGRTSTNQYFSALLAHRLEHGVSIGASAVHANLSAVDGVDLLYAGSDRIDQSGSVTDVRVGATKEWEKGHVLELLLLRNTTNMRHDVHFTTFAWNNALQVMNTLQRLDVNFDQTNIWGVHTEYVRPIGTEGWRIGGLATANRLEHPKIPNYVVQNLPRDPGTTNSFNAGLGAARESGPVTFGVDVILEPMTSNTYADAATSTTRADGSVIPAGAKTVENHFQFRNGKARMGVGRTWTADSVQNGSLTVNFGLAMYSISYDLIQTNNILRTMRTQHEDWVESGPTFGVRYRSRDIEVSYAFRANCGSDGCSSDRTVFVTSPVADAGGIIAAPSSALTLRGGSETSHHFTVSLPIR